MPAGNNPSQDISHLNWRDVDAARVRIPEPIRRWMDYEASTPFNPCELVQVNNGGTPWSEIWEHLLEYSRNDHCDAFHDYTLYHNTAKERAEIQRMKLTDRPRRTIDDWFSSKAF